MPDQVQMPPDDFVDHFVQRFGLSRDAADSALGELLVHYYFARLQRALASTKRASLPTGLYITKAWTG